MQNIRKALRSAVVTTLAVAGMTGLVATAQAQDYPSRAIKWIVPYLAGTAPDVTARIVADAMAHILAQPVIIENRGGAGGNLGAQIAARAQADGYTWVYAGSPQATNMRMYAQPGFDVMKDFAHVGRITQSDSVLVVRPDAGFANLQALVTELKRRPGELTYASGGVGSPSHMGAAQLLASTDTRALHVPYKGASESTNAVAGKQVDFAIALVGSSMPLIRSGKIKPLAVLSPQRNPVLKDVPTIAEAGLDGIALVSFSGLSVPKATPEPVQQKIRAALAKALAMPEVRAKIEASGATLVPSTPAQFSDALLAEIALTERLMKSTGVAAQ